MADTTRKERAKKPSVASHPLFSIVVVVWFGALFGLASLAIRPVLIEGLVSATGIDQVIPMAAPPLGSTARILIALLMTVLGCAVGALVARRFAKPAAQQPSAHRRPAASVQAEDAPSPVALFGAERTDEVEEEQPARRRRQLAIMEASDSFDDHAPLPGSNQILSVAELPLKSFDEVDEIWLHSSDRARPRTEDSADRPQESDGADEAQQLDAAAPVAALPPSFDDAEDEHEDVAIPVDGSGNRLFDSYVRRVNASVGSDDPHMPAPGFVSVPDTETPPAAETQHPQVAASVDQPTLDSPLAPEPATDTAFVNTAFVNTAERIATAPLDMLSHVELLERLAQTIARRRAVSEQASQVAAMPAAPAEEPVWFSAPQTVAAQGALPAALRPHWQDDADEDDDALPAIATPRSMTMTSVSPVEEPTGASTPQDPEVLDQGYSSLLGMTRMGNRQVFGRNDAPTASVVPSEPAAVPSVPRAFDAPKSSEPLPDQTEQALRAALATLRRMSGAA